MGVAGKKQAWNWDPKKRLAAKLCAENRLTRERIAEQVGIDLKTLYRWLQHDDFEKQVGKLRLEIDATMRQGLFGQKSDRVNWMKERAQDLARSISELGANEITAGTEDPRLRTGLFVRDQKSVGYGRDTRVIDVIVENPALKMTTALFDQIAKEQGDYVTRTDATLQVTSEEIVITEVLVDQSAGVDLDEDDEDDDSEE